MFFFSSRRRHTRWPRDWSSDVCSSDLINDEDFIEPALPDLARLVAGDRFINEPLMRRAINASLYSGTSEDAERLALLAERRDIPTAIREEALATLNVWEEPSLFDRVTGRYRGSHSNDPEMLYRALEPVLASLISDPEATIRASAARLVATAGYEPGRPLLGHLIRSEEHTSELQSRGHIVCRLLL